MPAAASRSDVRLAVATNPISLTFASSANSLTLSWPADHIGWRLQSQTNSLGTNWFDVPGSGATNTINLPIDSNNGSVSIASCIRKLLRVPLLSQRRTLRYPPPFAFSNSSVTSAPLRQMAARRQIQSISSALSTPRVV